MITTGEQVFVIENQKYSSEPKDYSATLFAINTASGKVQWQQKLPSSLESFSNHKLILENGTIYASHENGVMGFDPETGSPKTSFKYIENMRSRDSDRTIGQPHRFLNKKKTYFLTIMTAISKNRRIEQI